MRRTKRTRIGCVAVAMVLPVSLAGCSKTEEATPAASTTTAAAPTNAGQTVSITTGTGSGFSFEPVLVTVKAGTVITFKNDSPTGHTVKADSGQPVSFDSDTLATGDTFVQTINTPGTYTYFCVIHSKTTMSGTITVTP